MRFRCASCQVMTSSTSLSAPEVKALYARFRRLAPTGRGCVSTLDVDIPKPHPSTIAIFVLKTLSDETEMHVTRRECLFESWKHRTRSLEGAAWSRQATCSSSSSSRRWASWGSRMITS